MFPLKCRALGILLEWEILNFLSWQMTIMENDEVLVKEVNTEGRPFLIANLLFRKAKQEVFLSVIHKRIFSENSQTSFGIASVLFHKTPYITAKSVGEFWYLKEAQKNQDTLNYYFFPKLRCKNFSVGLLVGQRYFFQENKPVINEFLLQGNLYLTEEIFLSLDRFIEQSDLTRISGWALSLKTKFEI